MTAPPLYPVRALIFDLDGTLIDSKRDLIHSVNAMLREMGRPELPEPTISGYIGHGAPQLVARALDGTATEEEIDIDTFTQRVSADLGPDPVLVSGPDLAVWAKKP